MPKKVSTTPVSKQQKKTPIAIAETDQNWSKLTNSTTKKTRSTQECSEYIITHSTDENKFPHGRFNVRVEYMDGTDKRTCWFESKDQFIKHVTRYKITKYEATTNDLAVLGKSTGTKSKRV